MFNNSVCKELPKFDSDEMEFLSSVLIQPTAQNSTRSLETVHFVHTNEGQQVFPPVLLSENSSVDDDINFLCMEPPVPQNTNIVCSKKSPPLPKQQDLFNLNVPNNNFNVPFQFQGFTPDDTYSLVSLNSQDRASLQSRHRGFDVSLGVNSVFGPTQKPSFPSTLLNNPMSSSVSTTSSKLNESDLHSFCDAKTVTTGSKTESVKTKSTKSAKKSVRKTKPRKSRKEGYPKRPLSGYNFFFQSERQRILSSGNTVASGVTVETVSCSSTSHIDEKAIAGYGSKKSRHKKRDPPHRKISFANLGKLVAENWKNAPDCVKEIYIEMARLEKKKYDEKVKEYFEKEQLAAKKEKQNQKQKTK